MLEKKQNFHHISTQTMICFQNKELISQRSVKLIKDTDSKYNEYLKKLSSGKNYEFETRFKANNKKHLSMDPSALERELTLSTPPLNINKKQIVRK